MKSIKSIKKQAIKAAELSFKNGDLDENAARKFIKAFKGLPLNESVLTLNHYLRAIKSGLSKTTLLIESSVNLTAPQIKEIEASFKGKKINETKTQLSPSILGGVRVRIGDVIFDNSVRSRINQVKEALVS
jgi:F0F1-type ATP synthase delta subunit